MPNRDVLSARSAILSFGRISPSAWLAVQFPGDSLLLAFALIAVPFRTLQPIACSVEASPHLASTVEQPARLLNPTAVNGQFSELQVSRTHASGSDTSYELIPGVRWHVAPHVPLATTDNLIGFIVDSTGSVIRCSIRFRASVADSARLIALALRLQFAPARVADQHVPQLFVARLRR